MHKTSLILFSALYSLFFACSSLPAAADQRLTFIGTGDLQGQLEPHLRAIDLDGQGKTVEVVGGITRIATLINTIKKEGQRPVIVLSSGDDLMGRYFHTFDGKAIFTLLGTAGYEILALGNHEFDRGPKLLAEALEKTDFVPLCSDLATQGTVLESACRPFLLNQYGGIRIGFFSLMTPAFPYVTSSGNIALTGSGPDTARQMIRELRQQGADLVVAITHLGADGDRQLATEVEGIDLIFGGHSHGYLPALERVGKTLIVNGGEKGAALVRLDVEVGSDRTMIPGSAVYSLLPIRASIAEEPKTARILEHYREQLPAAIPLGRTDRDWLLDKKSLRSGESPVADMINDLIMEKFQVDIVLNNGGAFRGNKRYPAGVITNTMLHEIDEFENDVYLLKIKGKYLHEILEHSAALIGQGGFLQVAGLRLTMDPTRSSQEIGEQEKGWKVIKGGERLLEAMVRRPNGSYMPIEPEQDYSLATNAYLALQGGDRYYWFKEYGRHQVNTYTTIYSLLAEKLNATRLLNPPRPDGRLRIVAPETPGPGEN